MPDAGGTSGGQPMHGVQGGGSTPIPDPTVLTTEQVNRLERTMRVLITAEVTHLTELVKAESHGDRELVLEEFRGVESRFVALEGRTAEQKKDTKDALDAALAAQKEAVAAQTESSEKSINKSEAATGERIKAVEALLSSSSSALDGKLTSMTVTFDQRLVDVKERVARLEDRKLGADETKAQHFQGTDNTTKIVAMIAGILVVLIAAASLIYAVTRHPTTNGVSPAPVACAIAAAGETCVK